MDIHVWRLQARALSHGVGAGLTLIAMNDGFTREAGQPRRTSERSEATSHLAAILLISLEKHNGTQSKAEDRAIKEVPGSFRHARPWRLPPAANQIGRASC